MLEFTHVTQNPDLLDGKPCIRHLPITAATIISLVASGRSPDEITRLYPVLHAEDVRDALLYAAWRIDEPGPVVAPARRVEKSKDKGAAAQAAPKTPRPKKQARTETHDPSRPYIVMTRVGVFDRRLGVGVIAWRDIHKVSVIKGNHSDTVCLELIDPNPYLKQLPELKRRVVEFQMLMGTPPFTLQPTGTGLSSADLFGRIWRVWTLYRTDNWQPQMEIPEFDVVNQNDVQPRPSSPG